MRGARQLLLELVVRLLATTLSFAPRRTIAASDLLAPWIFSSLRIRNVPEDFAGQDSATLQLRARRTAMRDLIVAHHMAKHGQDGRASCLVLNDARLPTLAHPMILGTFHIAMLSAIRNVLFELPAPTLALRRTPRRGLDHPKITVLETQGDEQHRASVFHRAASFLRDGGFLIAPLDPLEAVRVTAPFLGRTLQLARGPFALSRLTGVPILPIVTRWNGEAIEVDMGEPISPRQDEAEMAAEAAAWLERHLQSHPEDFSVRVVELTK
jgi:hypothetical protein